MTDRPEGDDPLGPRPRTPEPPGARARRRVVVHGRVQGVFYRDSCRQEARRLGVAGFVRNVADGTVEAVFEGDPDAVSMMLDWAYTGPARAQVSRVDVAEEEPEGLTDFAVR